MEKKLFNKLNDAVQIAKIENAPITEAEVKTTETKLIFEDSVNELVESLDIKGE